MRKILSMGSHPNLKYLRILIIAAGILQPFVAVAFQQATDTLKPIKLWPKERLIATTAGKVEHSTSKPNDKVILLTDVTDPTIQVYKPAHPNGAAVIVCPGGGYKILAMDLEGTEICSWLNSFGVTAILLKYRVPVADGMLRHELPLQDAQRAMGLVRYNANKWGIKPNRIGIMGFSAGGHLSAALSTNFSERNYPVVDDADKTSCRPDFTILIYPAYLTADLTSGKLATEIRVTANTPPAFIMQTEDDPVNVENALFYYLALKQAKVAAEMHLYPKGGHGYGFRSKTGGTATYPALLKQWLKENMF
jgi:acetyl esterase/lipase